MATTNMPIIIPMNNTREVLCIVQDGVKYCEKTDGNPSGLGVAILFAAAIIGYTILVAYATSIIADYYEPLVLPFAAAAILLPLIVIGVLLL